MVKWTLIGSNGDVINPGSFIRHDESRQTFHGVTITPCTPWTDGIIAVEGITGPFLTNPTAVGCTLVAVELPFNGADVLAVNRIGNSEWRVIVWWHHTFVGFTTSNMQATSWGQGHYFEKDMVRAAEWFRTGN